MKKELIICAAGLASAAAILTGCGSSNPTLESISQQFLKEDADPMYSKVNGVTKYESEYAVAEGEFSLVSELLYKDLGIMDRTPEEFYNDPEFMKKWNTIQAEAVNTYNELYQKLQYRLVNNGFNAEDIHYSIVVADENGNRDERLFFYVDDSGILMDSLSTQELINSVSN